MWTVRKPGNDHPRPLFHLILVSFLLLTLLSTRFSFAAPPTVAITSPASGLTNDNTPLLTYTVDDPNAGVTVKVDSGDPVAKTSGDSLDLLPDGSHTIRVEATNASNETGFAEVMIIVDTVSPSQLTYISISTGRGHTMMLQTGGTLWAVGENGSGQLGDGTFINKDFPIRINAPGETDTRWKAVSAGLWHTLAVKEDGTLWAWGSNGNGQLGDGTTVANRVSPFMIEGTPDKWTTVAASWSHSLAVASNGLLYAWGDNTYGQLGSETQTNSNTLQQVHNISGVIATTAGMYHSMALTSTGEIYAWGRNHAGQVGNSNLTNHLTPYSLGSGWSKIAAGGSFSLALDTSGKLYVWGFNWYGQLGNNSRTSVTAPTPIMETATWTSISAGLFHTLATRTGGTLWAWGKNDLNQVGAGAAEFQLTPYQIGADADWLMVSAGHYHSTALKSNGTFWAWGNNSYGISGRTTPAPVTGGGTWSRTAAGYYHGVGIRSNDNTLWSWGYNNGGQLGDNSLVSRSSPAPVYMPAGEVATWQAVAAGATFTLGVKTDGTLWAWGDNNYGQAGDGTSANIIKAPVRAGLPELEGTVWNSVAAGTHHSVALTSTGELYTWGYNAYGQVGNGNTANQSKPVLVSAGGGHTWTKIAAGGYFTLAIRDDHTLWAWGYNGYGQLGIGSTVNQSTPQQVKLADNTPFYCSSVSAGTSHVLAMHTDGTLWAWGAGSYYQLGKTPPSLTTEMNPVRISAETGWRDIYAGQWYSFAMKSTGELFGWGNNSYGQLGDGTTTMRSAWTPIGPGSSWSALSAKYYHTQALKSDGTLWSWGYNAYGQLGDGAPVIRSLPAHVEPVIAINNGSAYTSAVNVTLHVRVVDANDISEMRFSNDGISWSDPEPFLTEKAWTLQAGDGTRTVYVKFKDYAGNWSTAFSDTITLDTTPPSVTIIYPTMDLTTKDNTPLLTYTVSEGTVVVKVDGLVVSKVSGDSLDVLANEAHTVSVEATDAAGNIGSAEIEFFVDTTLPTYVGGDITTDTVWTRAEGPYIVNSTVRVYGTPTTPVTLTIEPGTVVQFDYNKGIEIGNGANQGALIARGTAGARIKFTHNWAGIWSGITFNDGTVDGTTAIEYADIQYSTGIVMNAASPTFKNCTITDVSGNSFSLYSSSNPTMENVTITNNGTYGVYLYSSSPVITGGSLTNTNPYGQGIYGTGSPVVSNYSISIANSVGKYGINLTSGSTSALSITNSMIANGLYIGTTGITPIITSNTFTNADNSPIHAGANIIGQILNNNTFSGMTSAGKIEVVGETINQDSQWKKWPAPYIVSGLTYVYRDTGEPVTLTIDPGVNIKFSTSTLSGLGIGHSKKGRLVAQGTPSDRITMTRETATGSWNGLILSGNGADTASIMAYVDVLNSSTMQITFSAAHILTNCTITGLEYSFSMTSANPRLENVTIMSNGSYGMSLSNASPVIIGGTLTNTNPTGHGIYGSGSPIISNYSISIANSAGKYGINLSGGTTSALSITNSTIANGFYIGSTGITPTITGNTFTHADNSPIHAGANIIGQILNNNTFSEMTSAGKIEVVGETINQDALWKKWAAPYVVTFGMVYVYKDTTTVSTLTMDPGVTVKFSSGTGMQIGNGTNRGMLIARGAAGAGNNILFTSEIPTPGNWSGITLNGSASGASVLEYVTIEYAGTGAGYSNAALTLNSSSPVIRNSIIRNSAGSGVYLSNANAWPVILDSEITGNKWGVYSSGSNLYIGNSRITGNTTAGVLNTPPSTIIEVDARNNWWGAATGPQHASNSAGTGDIVSDKVLFNPWLGQSPGQELKITDARALPTALNPDGDFITFKGTISAPADWTITLTDGNNTTVKTFTGTGTVVNQRWYGEDSQPVPVKVTDGAYYYKIEAVDTVSGSTASAPQGLLMVSRNIPIAVMDPPSDNQMFTGGTTISITGTVSDSADFKNYSLDYGIGENPTSWTSLKSATATPVTNGLLHAWNTSSLTGGVYTLRLTVTDDAGNIATETARVRLLWTQNASASEAWISPNADGVKDLTSVSASFTHPSNWTLTIKDASSFETVRTFTGNGSSLSQIWDGKDSSGAVSDGGYTWHIDAISPETGIAAAPSTGTLTVDATIPAAQIAAPAANAVLWNTVTITGTASDANLDVYTLEHGPASGSGPWTQLATGTTAVTSGPLAVWITNDGTNAVLLANGSYLLRLSVADKAGNITAASVPVSIDNLILSGVSASSHTINTQNAESSSISYSLNAAADVTLKIIPERQGPMGTPVYQASQNVVTAGTYSFTWDGKDYTGKVVPDEAYLYVLEASNGTRTDTYSPPAPTGTGTVTCSHSGFDPVKNLPMTVTYVPAQPCRVNINIRYWHSDFKVLDSFPATPESHVYIWDGRSPGNKLLDTFANSSCSVASLLPENYIITSGDTITAEGLRTDPYAAHVSYGQITRIKYALSRDANVTVTITSPSGPGVTLVNNQFQAAGQQEVEWNGMDAADAAGKRTLVAEEGDYMVSVQTVNPSTGTPSTVRANIKIGY